VQQQQTSIIDKKLDELYVGPNLIHGEKNTNYMEITWMAKLA